MLACAKINLMLQVVGKREDNYHLLQSLVCFADVGDEVSLAPSTEFALTLTGEFAGELGDPHENLITKAAHALAGACSVKPHGHITLEKKLPIGAGLGGGSADAAAALRLLAGYWNCTIPPSIAAKLGSDIPACLQNAPCFIEGAGEIITPIAMPFDVHVLLVNPRVFVSSGDVYKRLAPPYAVTIPLPASFASPTSLLEFIRRTHNALEAPAKAIVPVIDEVLKLLAGTPQCLMARMSGSGATCFGLFASSTTRDVARKNIASAHPEWWVQAATVRGTHGQA